MTHKKIIYICIQFLIWCSIQCSHVPDFLILGTQKSGTTSLFNYLCQHPNIIPPKTKEVNFFTMQHRFNKGTQWYINQFPKLKKNQITGEATPCYILLERARTYIKRYFSHAKFIIIMRDPTLRAFSAYNYYVMRNNNPKSPPRHKEFRTFEQCVTDYFKTQEKNERRKFISRGLYMPQIKEWLKLFPRKQFLFVIFENFIADPKQVTNQVFEFLGLEPYNKLNIRKINEGKYADRTLSPETEQILRDLYRPYNQELAEFLGRELPWE